MEHSLKAENDCLGWISRTHEKLLQILTVASMCSPGPVPFDSNPSSGLPTPACATPSAPIPILSAHYAHSSPTHLKFLVIESSVAHP